MGTKVMNFLLTCIVKVLLLNKSTLILELLKEAERTIPGVDKGPARLAYVTFKLGSKLKLHRRFDSILMFIAQEEFNNNRVEVNRVVMKRPHRRRVNKWKHSQR